MHLFDRGAMDAIDLIVYLRIKPEQSLQRIRQRGRPEEKVLDLDSLKFLHTLHEQLFHPETKGWPVCLERIPILIIDSNNSVDKLIDSIQNYQQSAALST